MERIAQARGLITDAGASEAGARLPGYIAHLRGEHMVGALILLGLNMALAQEATAEPGASSDANEEMVVWGERVGRARAELDLKLRGYGYEVKRTRDGVTVYGRTGKSRWKPKVLVSDTGVVQFKNPVVVLYPPLVRDEPSNSFTAGPGLAQSASSTPDRGRLVLAFPVQVPAKRIQRQEEARVLSAVGAQIQDWQGALVGQGEATLLQGFPDKLDLLWEQGVDPRGGPALPDAASRKAALIELYRTRADTSAGTAVRAMIQDYIVEVVMSSPTPLSEGERAAAAAAGLTIP